MNKKIGIFTTFGSWDDAYSPCNVVKNHIQALVNHGYIPTLFVLDIFKDEKKLRDAVGVPDSHFIISATIPTVQFEPYREYARGGKTPLSFDSDMTKIVAAMDEHFSDIDVMFCHDIIFQDSFFAYNIALNLYKMPKHQKYYHMMHSGPSIRPAKLEAPSAYLYTLPPQSKLIYMNRYDKTRAAEMYGVFESDVRMVHNPIDYTRLPWIHPVAKQIIWEYDLNDADVVAVYPLSTTRMGEGGKQLHKAIKIMASLKKLGMKVKYIIPNAHANGEREKNALLEIMMFCKEYDVYDDILFTSLMGHEHGIPHEAVLQLFQYSDLFLFPSVSENCPLVLLEAALTKNLMVLNEDFSAMKDFVGPHALYFKFDSVMTKTNHPNGEDAYYLDCARIIKAHLLNSMEYLSKREIRQKFNLHYIFQNQIEPLFYE